MPQPRILTTDDMKKALEQQAALAAARPVAAQDRMTVVLQLYHQQHDENPTEHVVRHAHMLDTKHQAYTRKLSLPDGASNAAPIDCGWVPPADVGFLVVENRTALGQATHPTPEEKARLTSLPVYVDIGGGAVVSIRPGLFMAIPVTGDTIAKMKVWAGGRGGKATISIIPR